MFFCIFCLLTITGWLQVQCYVPVPSIYRKAEGALHRYSSNVEHNPIVYSLLNVLTHDKRAKAFITNEAIEKSLEDVKKFNENDEPVLRQIIYDTITPLNDKKLSSDVKEKIQSLLDIFSTHPNVDDNQTFEILSKEKNPKFK